MNFLKNSLAKYFQPFPTRMFIWEATKSSLNAGIYSQRNLITHIKLILLTCLFSNRASNPGIKAFMQENEWGEKWGQLEQYYIQRLSNETQNIARRKMNYIVWQESMASIY